MTNKLQIVKNVLIVPGIVTSEGRELVRSETHGDFDAFAKEVYSMLNCKYPKFYKMDRLSKLAFLAAELLMKTSEISEPELPGVSMFFENSASTLDTDRKFIDSVNSIPSPAVFVYTLPNIFLGELAIRHGWKGENLFLVRDSFSAEEFAEQIEMLYTNPDIRHCICGWIDYIDENNFRACIWLISKLPKKIHRRFSAKELASDYSMY